MKTQNKSLAAHVNIKALLNAIKCKYFSVKIVDKSLVQMFTACKMKE